jgi:hypothetical protein
MAEAITISWDARNGQNSSFAMHCRTKDPDRGFVSVQEEKIGL